MSRDAKRSAPHGLETAPATLPPWIVGLSVSFLEVIEQVRRLAAFDVAVLVEGETGVGKEMVVRLLHYLSPAADGPFVPVNAGAIPDGLFEDELFGHAAGAYTGARGASAGLVALAEGGTLFLDEIDSLSPHAQAALLRFLQDGSYRPVGARSLARSTARIVTATNADPAELMRRGLLRDDLYFRLSGITVSIPPLRERREDVLPLADYFLDELNAMHRRSAPRRLGAAMRSWLVEQAWPGNVRELRSVIERSFIMSSGGELLPPGGAQPCARGAPPRSFREAKGYAVCEFERRFLVDAMRESHGNVSLAARAAGKERKAFYRLLRKHGIDRSAYRTNP
jgi:DNA-binding NtrC family response regulator